MPRRAHYKMRARRQATTLTLGNTVSKEKTRNEFPTADDGPALGRDDVYAGAPERLRGGATRVARRTAELRRGRGARRPARRGRRERPGNGDDQQGRKVYGQLRH